MRELWNKLGLSDFWTKRLVVYFILTTLALW